MTQERFIQLIDNPDLVGNISYEELKTLAFAYPYAHNLRYLLALKARQENHPEASRMLQNAAAYSLDRTRLFQLAAPKQLMPQRVAAFTKEEVLELKPIETVQRELEALAPIPREEKREMMANEAEVRAFLPVESPKAPESPVVPELNLPAKPENPQPPEMPVLPKSDDTPQPFVHWMSQFNPPILSPKQAGPLVVPTKFAETEPPLNGVAQVLAEKSVAENKDVISETLARLLIKQGHRDKAIAMYERLCLAFPEKSAYFAAEIDKLKK